MRSERIASAVGLVTPRCWIGKLVPAGGIKPPSQPYEGSILSLNYAGPARVPEKMDSDFPIRTRATKITNRRMIRSASPQGGGGRTSPVQFWTFTMPNSPTPFAGDRQAEGFSACARGERSAGRLCSAWIGRGTGPLPVSSVASCSNRVVLLGTRTRARPQPGKSIG